MTRSRMGTVFGLDFRHAARRPLFWILLSVLVLLTWGLSTGNARIGTGDSDVGGKRAFITSEFAVAQMLGAVIFIFYAFFVSVAAGMAVLQDDELKVGELLHSTPLRPAEYVWGKFLAVLAAFGLVLVLHLLACIAFYQAPAGAEAAEYRGPFALLNYLRPALVFGVPAIVFLAGTAFWVGERSRRPILVFVLPVSLLMLCGFFLWSWTPSWLDERWNRLLMLLDPAGLRWLQETWLNVDRGVDFYNSAPIGYDLPFLCSRVVFVLIGVLAVVASRRHFDRTLRGARGPVLVPPSARAAAPADASAFAAASATAGGLSHGAGAATAVHAARAVNQARTEARPLSSLGMGSEAPSLLAGMLCTARVEVRELASQPGLYLFVPLIVLQMLGGALAATGTWDTALLSTPGLLASGAMNTLTLLLCLLLLFYNTESLLRERRTGLAPIHDGTPVRTASVLLGKCLANSLVVVVVLLVSLLTCLGVLVAQGKVPVALLPFVQLWSLLMPTLLLWSAFVTLVQVLVRSRYTTYALGLVALLASGYAQVNGHMNWVGNWYLWDAVPWSDMGAFALDGRALLANRVLALGLAALFLRLAVRWSARRVSDPVQTAGRLAPARIAKGVLVTLPWLAVPLVSGFFLLNEVNHGFQGDVARKQARDYWRKNLETWKDAPTPALADVELFVELDPASHWFAVTGNYSLVNRTDAPLAIIPVTAGDWRRAPEVRPDADVPLLGQWPDVPAEAQPVADAGAALSAPDWRLDGQPIAPVNSAQLWLVKPAQALAPGDSVRLGFRYAGEFPAGSTENGGGTMEFILPSGVVLTCFGPSFAPVIGFLEGRGVDEDNQTDAREWPENFQDRVLEPALGYGLPFTTRITLRAPQAYTLNSVGTRARDEVDTATGLRTTEWVSDHPVHFFNVVCGRWAERRGKGTVIYYHPEHDYNLDTMGAALDAARARYSEWFGEYPWQELKLSEFPDLARYAQGFPTNITFSEGIGFLNKDDPRSEAAFAVTAHETAHQWWGNILVPGRAPGGAVLSEGMAHFSTILLLEAVKGPRARIEFCKRLESRYGDGRRKDDERSLARVDGSRPGDTTVIYDRGGLVMVMLAELLGRESALAGLRAFIRQWSEGPDHPVMADLLDSLRPFAPDVPAFDAFCTSWILGTDVPEYHFSAASRTPPGEAVGVGVSVSGLRWRVTCRVTNAGTGSPDIDVAAVRGTRFPDSADGSVPAKDAALPAPGAATAVPGEPPEDEWHEVRTRIRLGPGESDLVELWCDFEPEEVLIDPDVHVLMLKRAAARTRF